MEDEEEGVGMKDVVSGLTASDPPPRTGSVAFAPPTSPALPPDCFQWRTNHRRLAIHSTHAW